MSVTKISEKSQAYVDGYQTGRTDKTIGIRSDYAWFGQALDSPSSYTYNYSVGYRRGWLGISF